MGVPAGYAGGPAPIPSITSYREPSAVPTTRQTYEPHTRAVTSDAATARRTYHGRRVSGRAGRRARPARPRARAAARARRGSRARKKFRARRARARRGCVFSEPSGPWTPCVPPCPFPPGTAEAGRDDDDVTTLELKGSTTPRVATARPRGRSLGPAAVRFARERLGLELLPWQEYALRAGCVRGAGGRWASRTVGVMVGRQNGKTRLVTVRALVGMCLWGERRVLAAAQNRDVALDAWRDALDLAEYAGLEVHDVCRTNGRECFWIGAARYKVVSATRRGGRGLGADLVILDELREYRDWSGWAALEKTRRARPTSQLWAISNEGDEGSIVLSSIAEQGRSAAESRTATDLAWMEWSAAPDLARTDPRGWRQSNPALGYLIPPDVLASEALHDDAVVFETEVLCRRVASLRPWLPDGAWVACIDSSTAVPDGADVVFTLDAGPELRHATIAVGWRRPDGRVYVEALEGYSYDDGPVLPRAAERLAELVARWAPLAVAAVARSSAEAAVLRALEGSAVPALVLSSPDLTRAATAFHEGVIARTVVHAGDGMLAAHVSALTSDGVLRRRSAAADVDAAYAVVVARHALLHAPARTVEQDWVAF